MLERDKMVAALVKKMSSEWEMLDARFGMKNRKHKSFRSGSKFIHLPKRFNIWYATYTSAIEGEMPQFMDHIDRECMMVSNMSWHNYFQQLRGFFRKIPTSQDPVVISVSTSIPSTRVYMTTVQIPPSSMRFFFESIDSPPIEAISCCNKAQGTSRSTLLQTNKIKSLAISNERNSSRLPIRELACAMSMIDESSISLPLLIIPARRCNIYMEWEVWSRDIKGIMCQRQSQYHTQTLLSHGDHLLAELLGQIRCRRFDCLDTSTSDSTTTVHPPVYAFAKDTVYVDESGNIGNKFASSSALSFTDIQLSAMRLMRFTTTADLKIAVGENLLFWCCGCCEFSLFCSAIRHAQSTTDGSHFPVEIHTDCNTRDTHSTTSDKVKNIKRAKTIGEYELYVQGETRSQRKGGFPRSRTQSGRHFKLSKDYISSKIIVKPRLSYLLNGRRLLCEICGLYSSQYTTFHGKLLPISKWIIACNVFLCPVSDTQRRNNYDVQESSNMLQLDIQPDVGRFCGTSFRRSFCVHCFYRFHYSVQGDLNRELSYCGFAVFPV